MSKLSEIFEFQKKPGLKAGDGSLNGSYPFYTSSQEQTLAIDTPTYSGPALIFGTGGSASIHYTSDEFSTSNDCYVVKAKDKNINTKLYYYFLKGYIHILEEGFRGAGLKHISKSYLSDIEVPLINPERANKIVEILDQAEELKRKREETIKKLEELKEPIFFNMFGSILTNDKGFEIRTLSELCLEIYRYPTFYGFKYVDNGVPVIKIGNILQSGLVDEDLSHYSFITNEINRNYPRTIIEYEDILMAVRGDGSTGKRIGIVKSRNLVGANMSPNLLRFKANRKLVLPQYLFTVLTSEVGQLLVEKNITRTAKKTITATNIKEIRIPVPSLELQKEFVDMIDMIENQTSLFLKQLSDMERLFNSVSQRAFSGELTIN